MGFSITDLKQNMNYAKTKTKLISLQIRFRLSWWMSKAFKITDFHKF
jgi:hypothetical protein